VLPRAHVRLIQGLGGTTEHRKVPGGQWVSRVEGGEGPFNVILAFLRQPIKAPKGSIGKVLPEIIGAKRRIAPFPPPFGASPELETRS